MIIRQATEDDITMLALLHATGFEMGWDKGAFIEFIQRDIVLVTDDPMAGFIIVRHTLDEAEIITLVVDPVHRQKGLGLNLLNHSFDVLTQKKVAQIFLEVASDNQNAIALYSQAGFTQIGRRKGYYERRDGINIDALVMCKQLLAR